MKEERVIKVLIVDTDRSEAKKIERIVNEAINCDADITGSLTAAKRYLQKEDYDIVISDLELPEGSGLDLQNLLKLKDSATPLVIVSGLSGEKTAVEAFRSGAFGYVKKGDRLSTELLMEINRAMDSLSLTGGSRVRNWNAAIAIKLAERTKELDCLYGISKLIEKKDADLAGILGGAAQLIPPAMLHPSSACARITVRGKQYDSSGFDKTEWMLSAEIESGSTILGMVEVCYLEPEPEEDTGPFLNEEVKLINAIAKRLGIAIENFDSVKELKVEKALTDASLKKLRDLFFVIDLEGNFLRWNNSFKLFTGNSDKELEEINIVDVFPDFNVRKTVKQFMKIESGSSKKVEMEFKKNGESGLLFEFDGALLTNMEGVSDSFCFIGRDITAHKRNELLLKHQLEISTEVFKQESLSTILETAMNASLDCTGLDTGAVYLLNDVTHLYELLHQRGAADLLKKNLGQDEVAALLPPWEGTLSAKFFDTEETDSMVLLENKPRKSLKSAAIAPLYAGGKAIGYILSASRTNEEISSSDKDVINTLTAECNQAAAVQKLEHKLRDSESRLRKLTDSVREPIFMLNEMGKIVFWNPGAKNMFGYSSEEAMGENFYSLVSLGGYQETVEREFIEYRLTQTDLGRGNRLEANITTKEGTEIPVEISLSSIETENGWQTVGIARESKKDKGLEAEIVRFKSIADIAEYGVVLIDLKGKIQYINPYLASVHGYKPEELLMKDVGIFFPEKALRGVSLEFSELLERGFLKSTMRWHRKKDNSVFPMIISASVVKDSEGNPLYIAASGIDISEIKDAQRKLEEAKEIAETASSAKSSFLAAISHELRTPLSGVIGMARVLSETELSSDQVEYADTIINSSEVLLNIINNILDFATLDKSEVEIKESLFNIHDMAGATVKAFAVRAREKGLDLVYKAEPGVPDYVVADPDRLRHIIVNLLGNALKFTEEGSVSVSLNTKSIKEQSATLVFSVHDTGIGIPADKQKKIFESFTQVDGSWNRQYGGAGLGLSVSHQLVREMKGVMHLESEPGKGSVFSFEIEVGIGKPPEAEDNIEATPDMKGEKVLVAVKSRTAGEMMEDTMTYWGMLPKVVDDGKNVLSELAEAVDSGNPFSLLIVDADLPGVDGFTIAKRVHENPSLAGSILFTLNPMMLKDGLPRLKALGIDNYITTPVKPSDLLNGLTAARSAPEKPAAKKKSMRRKVKPAAKAGTPLRILLAEDTLVNQKLIKTLLSRKGHEVTMADNGREALDALEKNGYDLVLMDVQMPEMDGFEATRIIRESEKQSGNHIPIIALTAHAMKGDKEKCIEAGMDSYLSKPVDPDDLHKMLESYSLKKAKRDS